jgi:hypothetical protein
MGTVLQMGERMAIRAQHFQVLQSIVGRIAVSVMDPEDARFGIEAASLTLLHQASPLQETPYMHRVFHFADATRQAPALHGTEFPPVTFGMPKQFVALPAKRCGAASIVERSIVTSPRAILRLVRPATDEVESPAADLTLSRAARHRAGCQALP